MNASPLAGVKNLLVRSTNWVGDAVMTLPALRELRRALPEARITILAQPAVAGIFELEPVADCVLPYTRGWRRTANEVRGESFGAALLLQNAFEAALVARWARIPLRCGYARDARSWLLTHPVPVPHDGAIPRHEVYYYLELLRRLGVIQALPAVEHIVFSGPPPREAGRELLAPFGLPLSHSGPVVGISPGAAFGTAKRWLPERYIEVGRAFAAQGARVVLFGTASERALADATAGAIGPAAVSTAGRASLKEFVRLVAGCDLYLTNDSGGMHLAAAAGVPVLAIFGPTDETGTAPLGPRARVLKKPVACSPCKLRECPIDHRCMTGIETADVLKVAEEMMQVGQAFLPVPLRGE